MGLSSKKTKTTPIVSDWMQPNLESLSGKIGDFADGDANQYFAPASALQLQAFNGASGLGRWKPYAQQAFDLAGHAATRAPSTAQATLAPERSIFDGGGIQAYMDPALESYVTPALNSYDADEGRRLARLQADGAKNQAFGGSRYGVTLGDFQAQSALGRAGLEAGLRQASYGQGLQTAQAETRRLQDRDTLNAGLETDVSKTNAGLRDSAEQRYIQAIGLLNDLANAYGANERGDLALLGELGGIQRGIDAEGRNALPTHLQMAGSLYGGIPQGAYLGQQQKSSGGFLGDLALAVLPKLVSPIKFG